MVENYIIVKMKEVYIAYFDLLGFKDFIVNNEDVYIENRMGHILRDIEKSLSLNKKLKPIKNVVYSDLSQSKLNCISFSDTVIFWTKECNIDLLKELVKVSYEFNRREVGSNFPLRGIVIKGKVKEIFGRTVNQNKVSYSVQTLYGKGIIDAYLVAENQDWAGTIIDQSIIDDLNLKGEVDFINEFALKYLIPFKTGAKEGYVFKFVKDNLNQNSLNFALSEVDRVFSSDNKSVDSSSVKQKIKNTKDFILGIQKNLK